MKRDKSRSGTPATVRRLQNLRELFSEGAGRRAAAGSFAALLAAARRTIGFGGASLPLSLGRLPRIGGDLRRGGWSAGVGRCLRTLLLSAAIVSTPRSTGMGRAVRRPV